LPGFPAVSGLPSKFFCFAVGLINKQLIITVCQRLEVFHFSDERPYPEKSYHLFALMHKNKIIYMFIFLESGRPDTQQLVCCISPVEQNTANLA